MVYVAADPVNGTSEHSEVGWHPWATAEGMLPPLCKPIADHLRAILAA
jgi:hypothetical protein